MKQKANLKKKIVPSLLTVSILCALYSTDALAVSINGKTDFTPNESGQYIIGNSELEAAKSHKFVIAQGDNVVIVKPGYVPSLISGIKDNPSLDSIRQALTDQAVVGVIGGEGRLDSGLKGTLGSIILLPTKIKSFYEACRKQKNI